MSNKINGYNYAITNIDYHKSSIAWVVIWEVIYNSEKPDKFFITNPKKIMKGGVINYLNDKKTITTVHINKSSLIEYYTNGIVLTNNGPFPNVIQQKIKENIYIKTEIDDTLADNLSSLPNCKFNL